ncbi:MAG: N-acetylmuramoyl-L-alanine amidase [Candidatus Sumerlaeaceae bacterium]|nr:N-acetylmuramoyl-L-alanine amidase [Candidatus Sumerlaeaceae bacterium]
MTTLIMPAPGATCAQTTATTGVAQGRPAASGYGMPDWFVAAVACDSFREPDLETTETRPFADALRSRPAGFDRPARQPSGALTGKNIFLMAGHGWTYSYDSQSWYTQRGLTHGIVEDFANHDQMCLFAHLAWNAGATIVPLRPVDHQAIERIVDDESMHAEFFGPWARGASPVAFGLSRGAAGYRVTRASLTESAVARFRPFLPTAGEYPVYAWARDGADRMVQLYRVVHAGGVTEVRLDHRRVGKGWIWLGTFPFDAGTSGFVEVSNQTADPYALASGAVAVADAIRFGNGRGDMNRGGGISGALREDEGNCYWIERSLSSAADHRIYSSDSADGNATVMAPPRTSAYMNCESAGSYFDRIYLSFHSNAFRGQSRGSVALWNKAPEQRPDYQEQLARIAGARFDTTMSSAPAVAEPRWSSRADVTSNWITFGELRRDYLQNEMCATIIEAAFHDNQDDARLLLEPRVRQRMAVATLRGVLDWLRAVDPVAANVTMMPQPPEALAAVCRTTGTVEISWHPPETNSLLGDPPVVYRIYLSNRGNAFGPPLAEVSATSVTVDWPPSAGMASVRVTAVNAGGESLPSETLAVWPPARSGPKRDVLVINGFDSLDSSMNLTEYAESGVSTAPATWYRVRPSAANARNYTVAVGDALTTNGYSFDAVSHRRVLDGTVRLANYRVVMFLAGGQRPEDGVLTAPLQKALASHLASGGHLFISGCHLAEGLERDGPGFLKDILHADRVSTNGDTRRVVAAPNSSFSALSPLVLDDASGGTYDALPADVIRPASAATAELLRYEGMTTGTAALTSVLRKGRRVGGRVVYFAFPFETIQGASNRAAVMRQVMVLFDQVSEKGGK